MGDEANMVAQVLDLIGSSVLLDLGRVTDPRQPCSLAVPRECFVWCH